MVADIEPLQLSIRAVFAVGMDLVAFQLGVFAGGRQDDDRPWVSTSLAI